MIPQRTPAELDRLGMRLERVGDFRTRLWYGKLAPTEEKALEALKRASVASRCEWATEEDWAETDGNPRAIRKSILLRGPLKAVMRLLRQHLLPDGSGVGSVHISQGKLYEIHEFVYDSGDDEDSTPPPVTGGILIE